MKAARNTSFDLSSICITGDEISFEPDNFIGFERSFA